MKSKTLAPMGLAIGVLGTAPLAQAQDLTTVVTDLTGQIATVATGVTGLIGAGIAIFILIWGVRKLKMGVKAGS